MDVQRAQIRTASLVIGIEPKSTQNGCCRYPDIRIRIIRGIHLSGASDNGPRHAVVDAVTCAEILWLLRLAEYPRLSLSRHPDNGNNAAERALRRPVVTRKNAYGSRDDDAARLAGRIWTVET
jgi:hypothetical protein